MPDNRKRFDGPRRSIREIVGPPRSWKSTYVDERLSVGDLVVDSDRIFAALSGLELYRKPEELLPFVFTAVEAAVLRLRRPSSVGNV